MTEAKRKAKILLLEQNKTFAELANDAGLALATIHNVLDGHKSSKKSKQAITEALRSEVFPGIKPRHQLRFEPGDAIESPTLKMAIQTARDCRGFVRRTGKI